MDKKKKYTINVHYNVMIQVEVEATSEDKALDLARDIADETSLNEGATDYMDSCVVSTEDEEED